MGYRFTVLHLDIEGSEPRPWRSTRIYPTAVAAMATALAGVPDTWGVSDLSGLVPCHVWPLFGLMCERAPATAVVAVHPAAASTEDVIEVVMTILCAQVAATLPSRPRTRARR